jgi:organic radical activating enzyme
MLPYKEWRDEHLVITGGEPLLGWQRSYPDLLSNQKMWGLKELTFETNGTQEIDNDFIFFLKSWTGGRGKDALTFSVSPKLSVSGEKWEDAIKPEIVAQYQQLGYTYLKFVVASKEDAEEAEQAYNEYKRYGFRGPIYLMGVGGTEDVFFKTNRQVADLALNKGWRYSDRMQVSLYGNAWGT